MEIMVKNCKNLTHLILSGMVISTATFSLAAMGAETQAPLQKVLPNSYGKASIFNSAKNSVTKETEVKTGVAYTLGSSFFDKMMDLNVTLGAYKSPNSAKVELSEVEVEAEVSAFNYNDKLIAIDPYVKAEVPSQAGQDATNGRFGAKLSSTYKMPTDFGVFGVNGYYDGGAEFQREPKNVKVSIDGKYALANDAETKKKLSGFNLTDKDGIYETEAKALSTRQEVGVGLTYEATKFVPGLSLGVKTRHRISGTPIMEYNEGKNAVVAKTATRLDLQQYDHVGKTASVIGAKYMLTDAVFVKNDLTVYHTRETDGSGAKKVPYENMFVIGANLF
jgi:hypothetical protein